MPDRILRDELLESSRWLDLPSNDLRVAFIALVLTADDYGNLEASPVRLLRLWRDYGCISLDLVERWLKWLTDCDLARAYEVAGKRYLHVPRFRQRRRYVSRANPPSPWDEPVDKPFFDSENQRRAEKKTDSSQAQVRPKSDSSQPKRREEKGSSSKGVGISNLPPDSKSARARKARSGGRRQIAEKAKGNGNGAPPFIDHWWEDEQKTRDMAAATGTPNLGTESWADWRHRIFAKLKET